MTQSGHGFCEPHGRYRLTCEQFDALLEFAGGRCQLCGGVQANGRALSIDHDSTLGFWAVRGLLCARCNTGIGRPGVPVPGAVDAYLADPWHQRVGLVPPGADTGIHVPDLDQDAARRLLAEAHADYLAAIGTDGLRAARVRLRNAVRAAVKSGIRQADVARAIGQIWTKDQVYAACFDRGRRIVPKRRSA